MRFGLSDEQKMLDDSVRGFLGRTLPLEEVRRLAADGSGYDAALASGLTEQGVTGLLVPEEHGGVGLGMVEAVVAAEAIGYAAAPFAFAGACVMAPLAIMNAGDDGTRSELLGGIAAGENRVAVDFSALAGATGAAELRLDGSRLSGTVQNLLDPGAATHLLVALGDGRMALVAADAAGVALELRKTIDRTRPLGMATFDGATARVLDAGNDVAKGVLEAGRLMIAADSLGAGQRMIDQAVAYANEREQFGRKIGSFQSVKHVCAEMVGMLEPCRSLIWYAGYARQHALEDSPLAILHAKAHLGEVTREVSRMATEVHGGMGFTDLLGLHYWFKRITFDRQVLGGPERCRSEAATMQGWAAA